jgi:hypothetical protein
VKAAEANVTQEATRDLYQREEDDGENKAALGNARGRQLVEVEWRPSSGK